MIMVMMLIIIMMMMISFIESSFDKDEVLSRGIGSATIQGMKMFDDQLVVASLNTQTSIIIVFTS